MKEIVLADKRFYRDAVFAVDPGACNLSGLAKSLPDMFDAIEVELGERDTVVRSMIALLNSCVDSAWEFAHANNLGTAHVNTAPDVKRVMKQLLFYAYDVKEMRRVAAHPIMRMMFDQMKQLSGVPEPDNPLYTTHWGEAYDICKERSGG